MFIRYYILGVLFVGAIVAFINLAFGDGADWIDDPLMWIIILILALGIPLQLRHEQRK